MKDRELDELEVATDVARMGVIDALIRLVNAMTEERNYYSLKCDMLLAKKEEQKDE